MSWTAKIAYAVGLMATDGNLTRRNDRCTMSFTSKDKIQVETLCRCLGVGARIFYATNGRGTLYPKAQWHDRDLYEWFVVIGLTAAKSLTLGPLDVPDPYFPDFFRGCIDGDGSIVTYTDRFHVGKSPSYVYQRLYVTLASASLSFVRWIRATNGRLVGVRGSIACRSQPGRHPLWTLRYAKKESLRLLPWMYYAPGVPCLARKRAAAAAFLPPQLEL